MMNQAISIEEKRFLFDLIDMSLDPAELQITHHGAMHRQQEDKIKIIGFERYENLLRSLSEKDYINILEEKHVILCPECEGNKINTGYSCPECNSTQVKRYQIVRHLHCGYTGKKPFLGKYRSFICPKCKASLRNERPDHDKAGDVNCLEIIGFGYECENGHVFERPFVLHHCSSCDYNFNYRKSLYRPVYRYMFTNKSNDLLNNIARAGE